MTIVVDASVAAKWYMQEPGCTQARTISAENDPIAPDLIVAEVLNAIWKNVRRKNATTAQLNVAAEALPRHLSAVVPGHLLAARAAELALLLDHPVYDCFYLALAERERCRLVTADQSLHRITRRTKLSGLVQPLSSE